MLFNPCFIEVPFVKTAGHGNVVYYFVLNKRISIAKTSLIKMVGEHG